jgi:hypothetical protein
MCLQCGMEEAAKHTVPAGKHVKVQCVHKSVPGLSSNRRVVRLSDLHWRGAPLLSAWPSITRALLSRGRRGSDPIYYCATGEEMPSFARCKKMKSLRDI